MELDCKLILTEPANYIKGKTFSKVELLGRLWYTPDEQRLLMLNKTLILPNVYFEDIAYHNLNIRDADVFRRLQNTACRALLNVDLCTSILNLHENLNLPTPCQLHCQHIVVSMFKFLNGIGPPYCIELFR